MKWKFVSNLLLQSLIIHTLKTVSNLSCIHLTPYVWIPSAHFENQRFGGRHALNDLNQQIFRLKHLCLSSMGCDITDEFRALVKAAVKGMVRAETDVWSLLISNFAQGSGEARGQFNT